MTRMMAVQMATTECIGPETGVQTTANRGRVAVKASDEMDENKDVN